MSSSSSPWSCSVCTYKNSSQYNSCEMCETPRNKNNDSNNGDSKKKAASSATTHTISKNDKPRKKKTLQRTLFGGIVDLTGGGDDNNKNASSSKKRTAPAAAPPPPKKKDAASRKRKLTTTASSTEFTSTSDIAAMFRKEKLLKKSQSQQQPKKHNIEFSYYCKQNVGSSTIASTPSVRQDMIDSVLKNVFGLNELRPLQKLSIATSLSNKNQLIVLATGGGKSLCYQLPACLLGGITIVISPLIALMQDQVLQLTNKFNIPAACISSSQKESDNKRILDSLLKKQPQDNDNNNNGGGVIASKTGNNNNHRCPVLLYITPESIQTDRMRKILTSLNEQNRLALFAVDEAHCLSSWGHDFRPAYRKLSWLRQQFPKVPVMACTATATPQVIKDIQSILKLENAALHKGSFDRPNIFYKVKYKDTYTNSMKSALVDLVDYIKKWHDNARMENKRCSGIVYVHKRDDTKSIATALKQARIKAAAYHAGLKDAERNQVQNDWSNNTIQVAVATVAFGMGIDLAHVRYVIHWTLPKTLEGFYQESGRAGRDGLPSQSILYYSQDDARKFQWLIGQQVPKKNDKDPEATKKQQQRKLHALEDMVNYCMKPQCRRNTLIKHFGGTPVDCDESCDYCRNPSKVERAIQSAAVLASSGHNHTSGKIYGGKNGNKNNNAWDGQWNGLHGGGDDDNNYNSRDWGKGNDVMNGLRITGPMDYGGGYNDNDGDDDQRPQKKKPAARFTTAASVLARYEAMECRENNGASNGFVRFRSKKDGGDDGDGALVQESIQVSSIQIPEHLRVAATSKSKNKKKKDAPPPPPKKTSTDHAAEADKLRAEIAKLDAEREERMKKLMAKYKKK